MDEVREEIIIDAPRPLVFALFRDPGTFVQIVGQLDDVERDGDTIHWEAGGPLGLTLRGEAELVEERKPERLAWRSTEGHLDVEGSAEFSEGDEGGTRMSYQLSYSFPGGGAATAIAATLSGAEDHVRDTLGRFKTLAEERAARPDAT